MAPGRAKSDFDPSTLVQVGVNINYLQSYEKMGKVAVVCVSGCSCQGPRTVIDALGKEHGSFTRARTVAVSESAECVLRLTVLEVRAWAGMRTGA